MVAASLQCPIPIPTALPRWPRRLTDAERTQMIECIDDLQFQRGLTNDLTVLSDDALWTLLATELAANAGSDCEI